MKKQGYKGNRKEQIEWYPSGWTHYLKTDTWEPPNYKKPDREPTFEEWKAQRDKEKEAGQK